MKTKQFLIALTIGALLAPNLYAQTNTATNSTKATATLATSCQFTAQSVSFGNLILPVTNQQSSSSLSVLCNKGATYSITMGTVSNIYIVTNIGYSNAAFDSTTDQQVGLPANWGTTYTVTSTIPGGGQVNPHCYSIYGCNIWTTGTSYGTMKGGSKGDSVAYSIKNPTDNTKVWNTVNNYSASGTGSIQKIPVLAEIIPGQTTAYPAPDMYTDTVTTQINF